MKSHQIITGIYGDTTRKCRKIGIVSPNFGKKSEPECPPLISDLPAAHDGKFGVRQQFAHDSHDPVVIETRVEPDFDHSRLQHCGHGVPAGVVVVGDAGRLHFAMLRLGAEDERPVVVEDHLPGEVFRLLQPFDVVRADDCFPSAKVGDESQLS